MAYVIAKTTPAGEVVDFDPEVFYTPETVKAAAWARNAHSYLATGARWVAFELTVIGDPKP